MEAVFTCMTEGLCGGCERGGGLLKLQESSLTDGGVCAHCCGGLDDPEPLNQRQTIITFCIGKYN